MHHARLSLQRLVDLTIIDLHVRREISNRWIASQCGWTPYDGIRVTGWAIHIIVRGYVVVRDEGLGDDLPQGQPVRFLESRNAAQPLCF